MGIGCGAGVYPSCLPLKGNICSWGCLGVYGEKVFVPRGGCLTSRGLSGLCGQDPWEYLPQGVVIYPRDWIFVPQRWVFAPRAGRLSGGVGICPGVPAVTPPQVVEDGYEFFAKRQLVTLFSAPNYCGEFDNAGAMMSVDETLMCSFQVSGGRWFWGEVGPAVTGGALWGAPVPARGQEDGGSLHSKGGRGVGGLRQCGDTACSPPIHPIFLSFRF